MIPGPEDQDPALFPTLGQAFILTLFAAFLQGTLFLLLLSAYGPRVAFVGISGIVAFGAVFALAAPRLGEEPAKALGFVPAPTRAWIAIPFLAAVLVLTSEIDNIVISIFPLPEEALERPNIEGLAARLEWGAVLIVALPVVEELFFRGLLQPGLTRRFGPVRAVFWTALLHGLAAAVRLPHLLPEVAARALVLGFVRHNARSLVPAIALASVFGLVHLMAIEGVFGIPGFDDTSSPHTPLGFLVPAGFLVGIGLALCRQAGRDESDVAPLTPPPL
jgi:membrane protease YdiL (CAAX protease family)